MRSRRRRALSYRRLRAGPVLQRARPGALTAIGNGAMRRPTIGNRKQSGEGGRPHIANSAGAWPQPGLYEGF